MAGCSKCKKKKIVEELPPIIEELDLYTNKEILIAYEELTSMGGVKEDKKEYISQVYRYLFNEELDYPCNVCMTTQVRKFRNFLKYNLNMNV